MAGNWMFARGAILGAAIGMLGGAVFAESHFTAEPQVPTGKFTTAAEVGQILSMTRNGWIAVREWQGQDLIYFTQILSWRCGLHRLRYSVNDGPMQTYVMPACHADSAAPNALLPEDGLPYVTLPLGSVETVMVELLLDDMSEQTARFSRADVLTP